MKYAVLTILPSCFDLTDDLLYSDSIAITSLSGDVENDLKTLLSQIEFEETELDKYKDRMGRGVEEIVKEMMENGRWADFCVVEYGDDFYSIFYTLKGDRE